MLFLKIFWLCDGVSELYIWGVLSVMGKLMLNGLGFAFCAIKKVLHFRMGLCKIFGTILTILARIMGS